jgi:ABC-type sugar transport system permease subunit
MEQAIIQNYKPKKKKLPFSRKVFIVLMIAYPLLQLAVFWLYVNFDTVLMSFQKLDYSSGAEVFVGWDNYSWVFDQLSMSDFPDLWYCIRNSVILFAVNNFVILPIALFCAYIFYKKLPGRSFFRVIFFLPNIISIVVLTMAFSFMFDSTFGPINAFLKAIGLGAVIPANGWLGDKNTAFNMVVLYCIWAGVGYDVVLITGAINRIPTEVIEAGKIDGIGMWREFFQVVLPMISSTIMTLFITGVTVIFTIFLQPMLLTNGGPYSHLSGTIALYIVELVDRGDLYKAAAVGMIFSIIGIPLIQLIKWGAEKLCPQVEY